MADDPNSLEFIVVDAGSSDETFSRIPDYCQVIRNDSFLGKKYASLNTGIVKSKGDICVFLDADTQLPEHFDTKISATIQKGFIGGAFDFRFIERHPFLSFIEFINRIRIRITQNHFGDQAVFCLTSVAKSVRGFPEEEIMESAYFCQELRKKGKLKLISPGIQTSARRFIENGILKVLWFDIQVWIRFILKLETRQFGKTYWTEMKKADL